MASCSALLQASAVMLLLFAVLVGATRDQHGAMAAATADCNPLFLKNKCGAANDGKLPAHPIPGCCDAIKAVGTPCVCDLLKLLPKPYTKEFIKTYVKDCGLPKTTECWK